jgi:hypothetical protein
MAKEPVDQSRTQWNPAVKNAAGKVVKKGYLSQYGRPEKRVTGKVKLVTKTGNKRAGQTQKYSAGRKVVSSKTAFGVGGRNPSSDKDGGLTAAQIAARKAAQEKAAQDAKNKKLGYQTGRGMTSTAATTARSAAQAKNARFSPPAVRARSASQAAKYAKNPYRRRWDEKNKRWVLVSNT